MIWKNRSILISWWLTKVFLSSNNRPKGEETGSVIATTTEKFPLNTTWYLHHAFPQLNLYHHLMAVISMYFPFCSFYKVANNRPCDNLCFCKQYHIINGDKDDSGKMLCLLWKWPLFCLLSKLFWYIFNGIFDRISDDFNLVRFWGNLTTQKVTRIGWQLVHFCS